MKRPNVRSYDTPPAAVREMPFQSDSSAHRPCALTSVTPPNRSPVKSTRVSGSYSITAPRKWQKGEGTGISRCPVGTLSPWLNFSVAMKRPRGRFWWTMSLQVSSEQRMPALGA